MQPSWVVAPDGDKLQLLHDYDVVIKNDRIDAVRPRKPTRDQRVVAHGQILLAGFISGHTHSAAGTMTRGFIEENSFASVQSDDPSIPSRSLLRPMVLMEDLSDAELDDLTALNLAEMLRSGCTTQVEMSLSLKQMKSYVRVAGSAFNDARFSGMSAGVPGTVAGWEYALKRYGRTSLDKALRSGTDVARNGFVVDQTFFDQTAAVVDYFNDVPSTAAIYLDPDGTPRDVGTTLRNPDMARAYDMIARYGANGFYRGPIAAAMVKAAQNPPIAADANHKWRPGLMTERDLAAYRAPERAPTRIGYKGLDVWGMGPPSSGGSTVGEILNILEGYPDLRADRTRALHRFLEASRYSFADRAAYLADPAYFDVPLRCLLSDRFAAERRAKITDTAATSPVAAGDCPGKNAAGPDGEGPSTTHLTVADDDGMVVSYTFTIESTGGNGIVVPGWGFLLNNELTDFDYTSLTAPNKAEGGKRPRSSMSPTIITKHGKPFLAVGSPGGSMIITTVSQVLLERLELGKTLPEAIAAPRASQRNTASTAAEQAFIDTDGVPLKLAPYLQTFTTSAEIGATTGIEFLDRGKMLAAAEPVRRGGGSAMVVKQR